MHLTVVAPLPDQPAVDRRLAIADRVSALRMAIVMRRAGDPVAHTGELDEITATIVEARNAGEVYDDWRPVLDDLKACRIALSWASAASTVDRVDGATATMAGAVAVIRPIVTSVAATAAEAAS